jgi:hypothetical protein
MNKQNLTLLEKLNTDLVVVLEKHTHIGVK